MTPPHRMSLIERVTLFAVIASMIDNMIVNTMAMNIAFPFPVGSTVPFWVLTGVRLLNLLVCGFIVFRYRGRGFTETLEEIKDNTEEILDAVDEEEEEETCQTTI